MCISIAKGNMLFIRRHRARLRGGDTGGRDVDRRQRVHEGKDLKSGLKQEDGQPRKSGI
jgi:hypothetical protein